MTKKELRGAMKLRSLSLDFGTRAAAAGRIFSCVERMEAFRVARTVALYCSLSDEVPTEEVLRRWAAVKRIVIPRVEGDRMRFFEYDPQTLCKGAFGIGEPQPVAVLCDPTQIDLMIVPGTAFTADGKRMGRGKGYYDKYLSQPGFRAVKVGVCYRHQIVGVLDTEPHDVAMDVVYAG